MTLFTWSQTAANNATADSSINAREGQAASTLNDSLRAMMAAVAKYRDDMAGNLTTGGTSTAFTITSNQTFTTLSDGIAIAARMHTASGASPTLNVDSLGAKSIASVYGTAIGAGKLRSGGVYVFVYDATDDKWIVQGATSGEFESGTKSVFRQTAAPAGWTKDTTYTDAALRVTDGTISQQATSGKEFSTLFAARTIAQENLPSYTLPNTLGVSVSNGTSVRVGGTELSTDTGGAGFGSIVNSPRLGGSTTTTITASITGSVTSGGSGTDLDFAVNYVDLIIATKD